MKKICLCTLLAILLCCGCEIKHLKEEKKELIDYTIVENADIPEELAKTIMDKKGEAFNITFSDNNYTYIVVGYGTMNSGGYSIQVLDLCESDDNIYIETVLNGPKENELVLKAKTYPFIVVKIERNDKNVIYN
ncbi:MAG: protease complex subunit PrcB family protein [Lachnospiraceae bacterium]|nr:protease complex subunit PrcB family protein [Lachnospiraceae bacterium]